MQMKIRFLKSNLQSKSSSLPSYCSLKCFPASSSTHIRRFNPVLPKQFWPFPVYTRLLRLPRLVLSGHHWCKLTLRGEMRSKLLLSSYPTFTIQKLMFYSGKTDSLNARQRALICPILRCNEIDGDEGVYHEVGEGRGEEKRERGGRARGRGRKSWLIICHANEELPLGWHIFLNFSKTN